MSELEELKARAPERKRLAELTVEQWLQGDDMVLRPGETIGLIEQVAQVYEADLDRAIALAEQATETERDQWRKTFGAYISGELERERDEARAAALALRDDIKLAFPKTWITFRSMEETKWVEPYR